MDGAPNSCSFSKIIINSVDVVRRDVERTYGDELKKINVSAVSDVAESNSGGGYNGSKKNYVQLQRRSLTLMQDDKGKCTTLRPWS